MFCDLKSLRTGICWRKCALHMLGTCHTFSSHQRTLWVPWSVASTKTGKKVMVFIVSLNTTCKGIIPVYQEQHGTGRAWQPGPSHRPSREHQEYPSPRALGTSLGMGQDIYTYTTKTSPECVYLCWQSYTQMPFSYVLIMYSSVTHPISGQLKFLWFLLLCYNCWKLLRKLWGKVVTAQGVAFKSR